MKKRIVLLFSLLAAISGTAFIAAAVCFNSAHNSLWHGYDVVSDTYKDETESTTESSSENTKQMALSGETEKDAESPYSFVSELGARPSYDAGKFVKVCGLDEITVKAPEPSQPSDEEVEKKVRDFLLKNGCTDDVSDDSEIEDGDMVEVKLSSEGGSASWSFVMDETEDKYIPQDIKRSLLRKQKGYSTKTTLKDGTKVSLSVSKILRAKELTDDVASECSHGGYKTKEEFKKYIKSIVRAEKYEEKRGAFSDALADEIIKKSTTVHFPVDVLKYDESIAILKTKADAEISKKSFKKYIKENLGFADEDAFYKSEDENIKTALSQEMILAAFAKEAGVLPDASEFAALETAKATDAGYASREDYLTDKGEGKIRKEILKEQIAEALLDTENENGKSTEAETEAEAENAREGGVKKQ